MLREIEGIEVDVVEYMKNPPDRAALEQIVAGLEDPVADLVRKDSRFAKLGLDAEAFVDNPAAVVDLLARDKALLQRPVLVLGTRAMIGRPKSRIEPFVAAD